MFIVFACIWEMVFLVRVWMDRQNPQNIAWPKSVNKSELRRVSELLILFVFLVSDQNDNQCEKRPFSLIFIKENVHKKESKIIAQFLSTVFSLEKSLQTTIDFNSSSDRFFRDVGGVKGNFKFAFISFQTDKFAQCSQCGWLICVYLIWTLFLNR